MARVNITGGRIDGVDVLEVEGRLELKKAARPVGFNALSNRYELKWVPGVYGIPSANADIVSATEATNITCDRNFEILGDNATTDDALIYAEGGVVMVTSGADNDECILVPHLDPNQSAWAAVTWGTDKEVIWEAHIQMGPSVASCVVWAGLKLTNTDVVATDANQAFFRYESGINGGRWQAVSSNAGDDTAADTEVLAVALDIIYHLKIVIDSDRVARFYIDGVLVETTAALVTAIDLKPYIGVGERGASAAKSVRIFGQAISRVVG